MNDDNDKDRIDKIFAGAKIRWKKKITKLPSIWITI